MARNCAWTLTPFHKHRTPRHPLRLQPPHPPQALLPHTRPTQAISKHPRHNVHVPQEIKPWQNNDHNDIVASGWEEEEEEEEAEE